MTILVLSTESYADAWQPCVRLFRKFWPQCQYERVIASDGGYDGQIWDFKFKSLGSYVSWCERLCDALNCIASDTILLMQEDHWLTAPVEPFYVELCRNWVEELDAVRLAPIPGPDGSRLTNDISRITHEAPYRVSCQPTIHERRSLRELARYVADHSEGTAADFEIIGTEYSRNRYNYACWKREVEPWPIQYLCSAISRGKYTQDAVRYAAMVGVDLHKSGREIMP